MLSSHLNRPSNALTISSDEILYHAKIHPEQYSNTLSDDQIKELNTAIHYVCTTSIDVLADSEKFPEHWLFKHRWSKGKKNQSSALPNGNKITFITVGGRTSAVVPAVQKKAGAVAKDVDEESNGTPANSKRKRDVKQENDSDAEEDLKAKSRGSKRKSTSAIKAEEDEEKKTGVGRRQSTRSRN